MLNSLCQLRAVSRRLPARRCARTAEGFFKMRVMALDTTTRAGSAALVVDDRIVDERSGDGTRTNALRLPGEILAIAEANGVALDGIDLYAVASGPGSFT